MSFTYAADRTLGTCAQAGLGLGRTVARSAQRGLRVPGPRADARQCVWVKAPGACHPRRALCVLLPIVGVEGAGP